MIPPTLQKLLLSVSNSVVAIQWFRVLFIFLSLISTHADRPTTCDTILRPCVTIALWISCMELVHILLGLTSSKLSQVLLFASVRLFVEMYVSKLLPCQSWAHVCTIVCWSVGEAVRFSCFSLDSLYSIRKKDSRIFKTLRYEVGRFLFPLGALCELVMVIQSAMVTSRFELYLAAALWPIGFIPLMRRLMKQRANHLLIQGGKKNVFV